MHWVFWLLLLLVVLVIVTAIAIFIPSPSSSLSFYPFPARSYQEAVVKFQSMQEKDAREPIREDCASKLLTHGAPREDAVVLLHGLTNCPKQWEPFARLLFERGANVIIPRLPYHGHADRLTTATGNLTGQDLVQSASEAVDIARGLGKRITVAGLSVNGTVAAWLPYHRADIDQTMVLAPFFAPAGWSLAEASRAANVFLRIPNIAFWWDSTLKAEKPGPDQAYPRASSRALAETLRVAQDAFSSARSTPMPARRLMMVTSAADDAINLGLARQFAEDVKAMGDCEVTMYEFAESQGVPHDLIDPHQPDAKTEIVYPKLLELFSLK